MYKIITFDIFDTLLHRKLRAPVDVFEAVRVTVSQNRLSLLFHKELALFGHQRIQAEQEARALRVSTFGGLGEVTFEEIYDRYQNLVGCSPEFRHLLQTTELEVEEKFLFPSPKGLKTFNELRGIAEQIAFISDMYLPSAWLTQNLERLGFEGAAKAPIFVSGEFRKNKHSGSLYTEVRNRLNIPKDSRWLHVGDNKVADIEKAEALGIETRYADWARVNNRRTVVKQAQGAYLVSSIIDSLEQQRASGVAPREAYASLGYNIFGPLTFGFMLWVFAQAREAKLRKLVFVARDGWLPFQLFRELKKAASIDDIDQSYIHFSRRVGLLVGRREWDVRQNWGAFAGRSPRRVDEALNTLGIDVAAVPHLLERHGFQPSTRVTPDKAQAMLTMLGNNFAQSLQAARKARETYGAYLQGHFEPGVPTGIVDIGWSGSIMRHLLSSLGHTYTKDQFTGLFLGLKSAAIGNRELGLKLHGWMSGYGNPPYIEKYLNTGGAELLEFALTADHGTTLGFTLDDAGRTVPVLEESYADEAEYRERAMKVQDGIREFVHNHLFLLELYDPALICQPAWSLPFERLVCAPKMQEIELLADLSHADSVGTTTARIPLATRQPLKIRQSETLLKEARDKAFWKAAFDILNR